jgi:prepilin-type N-terminal cleavage/methylation domain-containing protein
MTGARRPRARGFTVIEVMVSLVVVVIGLLGVVSLVGSTARANRLGRQLTTAGTYASQVIEDLRATKTDSLGASGTFPDLTTSDGTVFRRGYTVSAVAGAGSAVLITATVTFADDTDGQDHTTVLQLVRTTQEKL